MTFKKKILKKRTIHSSLYQLPFLIKSQMPEKKTVLLPLLHLKANRVSEVEEGKHNR